MVQYYTVNLVSSGFVVDSSAGDPLGTWRIEFSRGELRGEHRDPAGRARAWRRWWSASTSRDGGPLVG